MEREYAIVLAAGVVALAFAGASRAKTSAREAPILENGVNAEQQRSPLGATYSDKFEVPASRIRSAGEFPFVTPSLTDRSGPGTISACPMLRMLPQTGPLVS